MNGETAEASVHELGRLDQQIAAQQAQAVAAHRTWVSADAALRATIARRDAIAARLRAAAAAPAPSPVGTTGMGAATGMAGPVGAAPAAARETSTRTVQNVLFILGGLLLGTAAIVFTAVAWTTFGVQGRAAILGVVTLVALVAPVVALWRKLYATAETVAAIALLLVLLDGFAAWSVNLFDAQTLPSARYAGLVALAVAAVGLAYRLLTRLVGPALVALLAIQPVVPLFLAPEPLTGAAWSLVWSSVAVLNLGVAWLTRDGREPDPKRLPKVTRVICRAMSLVLYGTSLAVAALVGVLADLFADTVSDRAQAGAAIVVVATVFAASTALSRSVLLARCAGAVVVISLVGAVGGVVAAAWPGRAMLTSALVVLAAALAAAATRRLLPAQVWPGPAVGAAVAAGAVGLFVGVAALFATITTIASASPLWSATLAATGPHPPLMTWHLPVAILAVAAAFSVLVPQVQRAGVIAAGAVVGLAALPASVALVWWAPAMLSLAGAAVAAVVLVLRRSPSTTRAAAASALALTLSAVATAGARPALTAVVLGAIALLSLAVAVVVAAGRESPSRSAVAGAAPFIGLLAVPPAIGSALVAAEVHAWWAARGTVIAVGVLVLALGMLPGSRWPALARAGYRAVLVGALVWPTVGAVTNNESAGIYASVSLLLVALDVAVLTRLDRFAMSTVESAPVESATVESVDRLEPEPSGEGVQVERAMESAGAVPGRTAPGRVKPGGVTIDRFLAIIPAGIAGLVLALSVLVPVLAVVVWPYTWLTSVWSGQPSGVGLTPGMTSASDTTTALSGVGADAVALAVLALASAVFGYARTRRPVVALAGLGLGGPTAILLGLVATEAPWPSVPAATLLIGLSLALFAALTAVPSWRAGVATVQAVGYVGAGVAGSLVVEWATLAALGAVTVTAAVVGAVGRSRAWRVVGWLVAVGAAVAAAAAAGFAADLPARNASVGVLAIAVVALFFGATVLRPARAVEANATEAAAHAGAVVAVIFTLGWTGRTALVCLLWGTAVGLRALLPGTSRPGRAALAAVAAGFELLAWWLLLTSRGVTLVEAYTVPLALVALLAGRAALRARPDLRSWVAYGPALVAGFAPSLAVVLGAEGAPLRRLALGAAALGVVVWGSIGHRQAPVVIGGVVLVLVALHELVLLWQRIPGWIPLALGGLILLGLAITYERRLRDVRRLRTTIGRMT